MNREPRIEIAAVGALVALAFACGGGGGGGGNGPGGGSGTIQGNISSASTAAMVREPRSWIARLGRELDGFAREAFAASDVSGVQVRASGVGASGVTDLSDDTGAFTLLGSPTGNVTVIFSRDRCQGEVILPDVANGSVLIMEDVTFDCTGAEPATVSETFRGVARTVPSSREGSLTVCVSSGNFSRLRVVTLQDVVVRDSNGTPTNFNNLAAGQLIETSGDRQAHGSSSVVAASTVKILGTGSDDCPGPSTPTPGATETPASEATPTATPSPTP
jgi:hypothetical protein